MIAGDRDGRALDRLCRRLAELGAGLELAAVPPPGGEVGRHRPPGRPVAAQAAQHVLRQLLSRHSDAPVTPGAWILTRSASGQLLVTGPGTGLAVSLAYTPQLLVAAVARGRRVGVDLEPDCPVPEADLPLHLLSPAERAIVARTPEAFLVIWTLKEALAKERGEGLLADCPAIDTAPYARAAPFALVERADGGIACHARFRSGNKPYRLALALGPLRR